MKINAFSEDFSLSVTGFLMFSFVQCSVQSGSWAALLRFCFSGFSHSDQPSGADPHQAAVSETVVQGADWLHPLCSGGWRLAVSLEGSGAHAAPRRALLSHVLVQLWEKQELAVWAVQDQQAHIHHHLCIWSGVGFCECLMLFFSVHYI